MKTLKRSKETAFTVAEMLVALAASTIILAAVVLAGVSLQRSFAATENYSNSEGDQLRVMDYIAMDCRRAVSASVDSNSGTLTLTLPSYYPSPTPASSASPSPTPTPTATPFNPKLVNGVVAYTSDGLSTASPWTTTVTYSKSGTNFNRQVVVADSNGNTTWSSTTAIAKNVSTFSITPEDLTTSLSCTVMFFPTFIRMSGSGTWRNGNSAPNNSLGVNGDWYVIDPTAKDSNVGKVYYKANGSYSLLQNVKATTIYCNTFLRNAGARQ